MNTNLLEKKNIYISEMLRENIIIVLFSVFDERLNYSIIEMVRGR